MYVQPQQRTYYLLLMFRLLARRNYSIHWRFKDVCPSPNMIQVARIVNQNSQQT